MSRARSATRCSSIPSGNGSMPEARLPARTALAGIAEARRFGVRAGAPGIVIEERTGLALASVIARRGNAQDFARAVAQHYGLALPMGPRFEAHEGIAFAGLGPDQWLAIAEGPAAADFIARLSERVAGLAAVSDQSDGRVVVRVSGPRVHDMLAKGVPIDLHPRAFKTGDVASTLVAHIGVQLRQLDDQPTYELMAFRSLAGSF